MYKLNSETNGAKFFEWLWNTDVKQFKTMCPYFWAYVVTIIIFPVILAFKLLYFITPAKKTLVKGTNYIAHSKFGNACGAIADYVVSLEMLWSTIGTMFKWLFFIAFGVGVLSLLVFGGYKFYQYPLVGLAGIGALTIIIGVLFLIFYLFCKTNLGNALSTPFRWAGIMAYSTYKGLCPLVNWN
jgi:hypothetical protein